MPQTQGKKRNCDKDELSVTQCDDNNSNITASTNLALNSSGSSIGSGKSRKRKRCDKVRFSDLESEFEDCDLEDAAALETKLRKVARKNSLTHDEMMKLLHKFVKNEHILALVTIEAEKELAKEKQTNDEHTTIIITETPSIPKLTRAKARELNKTPILKLPSFKDQKNETEIAALIKDDLHSDEEDEEYVFKEEDFVSDDDPNITVSDLESNPRTPQTPASQYDDSPVKLSDDGCFKLPLSKKPHELSEELRIAARTRSKFCLQQTTIEDLQSEFVPPDVEEHLDASDLQPLDEDWMQFLNDFTKPLNNSLVGDDDDPINDPEYIAAEKEQVDAEELRDVNIPKKELNELVAELYDSFMAEGFSMESIDLETPRKFLESFQDDKLNTPNSSPQKLENDLEVSRQLDFDKKQDSTQNFEDQSKETSDINSTNKLGGKDLSYLPTGCNQITSTNCANDYTFQPDVMSTPSTRNSQTNENNKCNNPNTDSMTLIPIAQTNNTIENSQNKTVTIDTSSLNTQLELIAVPVPGQPNCFQLAKVVNSSENFHSIIQTNNSSEKTSICSQAHVKHDANNYVSVKRHIIAEYINKFKALQHAQDNKISSTTPEHMDTTVENTNTGFTQYQYDLMQQQLRIHIQFLTQTFVQTYCHPELWKVAPKPKEMLLDLKTKAEENVNFQAWNLKPAIDLIHSWQNELDRDTSENTELMNFLHYENTATLQRCHRIPRFHPRMLECYLNSPVFMYPQYLPRMPFTARPSAPIFSPVEAYLIAMGLEKHLQIIYETKEKISKSTPLRVACKRLSKDMVCGKRCRRIWDHVVHLQKVDYYNPIKYFFEHNRAPPVDHDPIWTFQNNIVLPPKDRIPELPLVFQTYLQKKNEPPKLKANKKSRKKSTEKVSEAFKNSYREFVQEIVGQDIPMPNLFYDPVESNDNPQSNADVFAQKRRKLLNQKPSSKRKLPQSLTINVNYVYGSGLDISNASATSPSLSVLPAPTCNIEFPSRSISNKTQSTDGSKNNPPLVLGNSAQPKESVTTKHSHNYLPDSTINTNVDLTENNVNSSFKNNNCPVISYNFDWRSNSLQPALNATQTGLNESISSSLTDNHYDTVTPVVSKENKKIRSFKKVCKTLKLHKRIKQKSTAYREKRQLKRRCEELITTYSLYLDRLLLKYKDCPVIQHYYRRFKALELYTNLLKGLESICKNMSNNSPSNLKRARNTSNVDDENNSASARQVRKLNRQEENFRHMLLPDTPEETNRKDAIYAFNFYEKVEEAFKAADKPEDCKKFNDILKSFDPKEDKVSDLYYKLEKLFLPDHPELAQVFLTFLLPSEAAEIGKFFEHFMINNMTTFINKLNVYFNKQPAQIRKVYNCLNDLAEDPDITMKKVEAKVIPLLKGNQFLIDWFMQQFQQNAPPERLFSKPEQINLKDQLSQRSGEHVETITDLIDSPTNDGLQQHSCQLRYINGRIFYGSKMPLPAKLSFMANSYKDQIQTNEASASTTVQTCVHGIREHGEKRLQAAAELNSGHITMNEQDKSEEDDDTSKALVIDTTVDEEDSCSSIELCDEVTLKAHAARLNPSVYSGCYPTANATSTPNLTNNFQSHHPNAKKTSLNFNDEAKLSPRKNSFSSTNQGNAVSHLAISVSSSPIGAKEKRKSPIKKTKSPSNSSSSSKTPKASNIATQPMVVIHEPSSAIQCAKRLKSLIEGETLQPENVEETIDTKEILKIVAKPKNFLTQTQKEICKDVKEEEDCDLMAQSSALSPSPFPSLRMEVDSNEEDNINSKTSPPPSSHAAASASDEDCKIDIVSSLTTDTETNTTKPSNNSSKKILPLNAAWTRDEDKTILIEMKIGSQNRQELYDRIAEKLQNRTMFEITSRHQFLMDFLSKLQGK